MVRHRPASAEQWVRDPAFQSYVILVGLILLIPVVEIGSTCQILKELDLSGRRGNYWSPRRVQVWARKLWPLVKRTHVLERSPRAQQGFKVCRALRLGVKRRGSSKTVPFQIFLSAMKNG